MSVSPVRENPHPGGGRRGGRGHGSEAFCLLSLPWPGVTERVVGREIPHCLPLASKEERSALRGIYVAESVLLDS